jgi:hypothetical protein
VKQALIFIHLVIKSEAWWIGTKEENPEELKLDFLKELFEVLFIYVSVIFCFWLYIYIMKEKGSEQNISLVIFSCN